MADFADQASHASEGLLADALAKRARDRMSAPAESATECEECGELIPEARRQAVPGCTRCIECQETYDRTKGWI